MIRDIDSRIIGLTGGIGSGKSVVARILRLNGYEVYDCDSEARHLMECSEEIRDALKSVLGDSCYLADGRLNREMVAGIIFKDANARENVNSIVHQAVRRDLHSRSLKSLSSPFFCESAILASSGLHEICSAIWIVTAPESLRIERVISRNGLSPEGIMDRIRSQEKELLLLEDQPYELIDNSGESSVVERVFQLLDEVNLATIERNIKQELTIRIN